VSLDEAYRYAYRRTLVSTSQTKVGGQHVTLETDLAGQGDVPVTYPAEARSQLELPASLDALVLVHHRASGNVVAEVQKAPGSPVKLAFPAGAYEAIVRRPASSGRSVLRCALTLTDARVTALDLGGCQAVELSAYAKGGGDVERDGEADEPDAPRSEPPDIAPWQVESGIGFLSRRTDAYTRRLNEFGYRDRDPLFGAPRWRFHFGVSKGLLPHLAVGAYVHSLGGDTYDRELSDSSDSFSWDAYGVSAFFRASSVPSGRMSGGRRFLELYAQGAIGLTMGITTLKTGSPKAPEQAQETTDIHWGWVIGAHAGIAFTVSRPLVVFFQGGYEYAPTIANLLGETHDAGGPSFQVGLRLRFE